MDKAVELKKALNFQIFETLSSENFKKNLRVVIYEELIKAVILKKDGLLESEVYSSIKLNLKRVILGATNQQSFKESICKFIDENLRSFEKSNKSLSSIIPPAFTNSIKVYVYNNSDDIASTLKDLINNENVIKKINTEVSNVLKGLNPMISRFISATTIQTKIISGINDYLNESKNMVDIVNIINSMLDNLMKKNISEFASYFPAEGRKSLVNSIATMIMNNIFSEDLLDFALSKFEEILRFQLKSIDKNSESLNKEVNILVENFINNSYDNLLKSDCLKELVELISSNLVENLLNKPLTDFI